MPTVKLLPDSNVNLKPPAQPPHASAHPQRFAPSSTHIALALAALAVILLARFTVRRFSHHFPSWAPGLRQFERGQPGFRKDSKAYSWVSSAPTPASTRSEPLFHRPGFERAAQTVWAAGLLASPAGQVRTGPTTSVLGMEEQKDQTGSRGVSASAASSRQRVSSSHADLGSRKASPSLRSSNSPASSSRRHSTSSNGSAKVTHQGKVPMDGDSWDGGETVVGHGFDGTDGATLFGHGEGAEFEPGPSASSPRFMRPVPPPPLTPPTLFTGMVSLEDRRPNYAVSIPAQLDAGFIHQPNPDYMASSTSAEYHQPAASPKSATATPRRRSYTKSVPIGIPTMPSGSSSSSSHQSRDMSWGAASTDAFSPSSYPPSSPQLPPPPPGSHDEAGDNQRQGEIDLQGEIISVMDDAGHGWKRHTRVYGGGVCLACIAAGDRDGGFYGDKVPLSERR